MWIVVFWLLCSGVLRPMLFARTRRFFSIRLNLFGLLWPRPLRFASCTLFFRLDGGGAHEANPKPIA